MPRYRGSIVAKHIIDDRKREARDKIRALKERGDSYEYVECNKQIAKSIIDERNADKDKYTANLYRRGQENGNSIYSNYTRRKGK
jgi:hypothetical protein